MNWIPTKHELPESSETVLVTLEDSRVCMLECFWTKRGARVWGHVTLGDDARQYKVTAWQPLPTPYEDKK